MKQCPNCGAQAQEEWILCPSCKIDLRKAAAILGRDYYTSPESEPVFTNQVYPAQEGAIPSVPITPYPSNRWLLLLLFGMIPAAIIWAPLGWIGLILSVVAVDIDATNLHAGKGQKKQIFNSLTWAPHSWALLVFLVWIIGMLLYLFRRRQIWEQSLE